MRRFCLNEKQEKERKGGKQRRRKEVSGWREILNLACFLFLLGYNAPSLTLCENTNKSVDPTATATATRKNSCEALMAAAATAAGDLGGGSSAGTSLPSNAAAARSAVSYARASAASTASGVTETLMRRIPGKNEGPWERKRRRVIAVAEIIHCEIE